MNRLEHHLIDICAPTLAGIKIGSLFHLSNTDGADSHRLISIYDTGLKRKGVRLTVVQQCAKGQLVYVFRPAGIEAMLSIPHNANFLKLHGYSDCRSLPDYIAQMRRRLTDTSFPHEIGLFLGYPLNDVVGYIANAGRNYCCSGYWKVYSNQSTAERCFQQYRRCACAYKTLYNSGKSIFQLTAASAGRDAPVQCENSCYNKSI